MGIPAEPGRVGSLAEGLRRTLATQDVGRAGQAKTEAKVKAWLGRGL